MSAPSHRLQDPSSLSFYAAREARTARPAERTDAAPGLVPEPPHEGEPPISSGRTGEPLEGAAAMGRLRGRRPLDPDFPAAPPLRLRERSSLAGVGRLVAVLSAAALIALVAIGEFPFLDIWRQLTGDRVDRVIELASSQARSAPAVSKVPAIARLIVQPARGDTGDPVPLGVALQGPAEGASVLITGLASGMTLSSGEAAGAGAWQLAATDLGNTVVLPPRSYVGSADLIAELRVDDRIADRRSLRLEWMPPPVQRQLDREEIAVLLKRGRELVADGDLAAARLILQRAAEADDAEAALVLAATYDPFVLRELKVYGLAADPATARAWYERAKALGSAEAPRRLEMLASGTR